MVIPAGFNPTILFKTKRARTIKTDWRWQQLILILVAKYAVTNNGAVPSMEVIESYIDRVQAMITTDTLKN
jgi:hypothetical protein